MASSVEQLTSYFAACGMLDALAAQTAKGKLALPAQTLFQANRLAERGLSEKQALLAFQVAKDGAKLGGEAKNYAVQAVVDGRLKSPDQVAGALAAVAGLC